LCSAHDLEVDEFAARPEEDRLTAAEKNERINKQLQVSGLHLLFSDASNYSHFLFASVFSLTVYFFVI